MAPQLATAPKGGDWAPATKVRAALDQNKK